MRPARAPPFSPELDIQPLGQKAGIIAQVMRGALAGHAPALFRSSGVAYGQDRPS
jgi:hypothetical protein